MNVPPTLLLLHTRRPLGNSRSVPLPRLLAAAAMLCLPACDPVEEKPGPAGGAAYIVPPPEPRRNPSPSPEVHQWLEAAAGVRRQIALLREELTAAQQLHTGNRFDEFLAMDPATLDAGQLCYLNQFLDRGYFRIEREVLLHLLRTRRTRSGTTGTGSHRSAEGESGITPRLQAALARDETLAIDLEAAVARYREPGDEPFEIPVIMTPDQVETLRAEVTAKLTAERRAVAALDGQIAAWHLPALPASAHTASGPAPETVPAAGAGASGAGADALPEPPSFSNPPGPATAFLPERATDAGTDPGEAPAPSTAPAPVSASPAHAEHFPE